MDDHVSPCNVGVSVSKCDIGWFANAQHKPALSFKCTNLYISALLPDHVRCTTCHDRRLSRAPSEHLTKENNQQQQSQQALLFRMDSGYLWSLLGSIWMWVPVISTGTVEIRNLPSIENKRGFRLGERGGGFDLCRNKDYQPENRGFRTL